MRAGFTLIELLLVLALLAIVMSFAAPSLANFFRGRSLDSEARRILALAHHAQSRAVSEGIPVMLWINEQEKSYGAEQEPGWEEKDSRAVEFKLNKDLAIAVINTNAVPQDFSPVQLNPMLITEAQRRNLPEIRFMPDGSIDQSSPTELELSDKDGLKLSIGLTLNRLNYEIRSGSN